MKFGMIGNYEQLRPFTNENAGTAEWCTAKKDGATWFVKKFQTPVYPSADLGLSAQRMEARKKRFHQVMEDRRAMYAALKRSNTSGALVVPEEVMVYQYHLLTIAEFVQGSVKPTDVHKLSEWQRIVLMRTLVLALMNVHAAGIVHADMKPENLLITQNPETGACRLRLIDFDSSHFAANPPKTAEDVVGDMAYWAPEIYKKFRDESVVLDQQTDVFALGIILHVLWTGKLPEKDEGKTIGETLATGGYVKLDSSMPLVMQRVINGLMHADPKKRIACAGVYQVLGVQMEKYSPDDMVILSGVEPVEALRPRKETGDIAASTVETVDVKVICTDLSGRVLETHKVTLPRGKTTTVSAYMIKGYKLANKSDVKVTVNADGSVAPEYLRFTYERQKSRYVTDILIGVLGAAAAVLAYFYFVG